MRLYNDMLQKDLENLGLSEKEAAVYLAALELGTDTVQNIAKKSKVKRVTTYVILKSLMKKGLASQIEKGKKALFVAEEPERLSRFVDQQIKELTSKKETLQPLLDQLKVINNLNAEKPLVRFFEGKEGVDALMDEFIREYEAHDGSTSADNMLYLAYSRDKLYEIFTEDERKRGRTVRLKANIESRSIYNWRENSKDLISSKGIKVSDTLFPFPCDIAVYKNKIRLISLGDVPNSILIIDSNLAEGLRSLFKLALQGADQNNIK